MNLEEVVSSIILDENYKDINYNDEELELIYRFWDYYRDQQSDKIEEIKKVFLDKRTIEEYNLFIKIVNELNKDFYAFEYFRDGTIDNLEKNNLINRIFNNFCLKNNYNDILNIMIDEYKLNKNIANDILNWFLHALEFSIENNYDGKRFIKILVDTYLIQESILKDLMRLYDDNLIMLKLNYIIKYMNK